MNVFVLSTGRCGSATFAKACDFLKDETKTMTVYLESVVDDFRQFWVRIGTEGPIDRALAEWNRRYNASRAWW